MPLILPGNVASATAGAFSVANSCRFNDGDSPKLTKTPGSTGNQKRWTYSFWIKRCTPTLEDYVFYAVDGGGTNKTHVTFSAAGQFRIYNTVSDSTSNNLKTNRLFRDPSAWYHIVVVWDAANGTTADRIQIWVNGVRETSFAASTLNDENSTVNNTVEHTVSGTPTYIDGYMAEVCFIDGTVYTASDFGEFDEDSPTIWKPKDVSGLTFGTNGFYLDFEDSANLGNDANGGTDLSETNLAAADQATDTPTNNFCTMNPLDNFYQASTFSEGNCVVTTAASAIYAPNLSTIGFSAGKWYWEFKAGNIDDEVGIQSTQIIAANEEMGNYANDYCLYLRSGKYRTADAEITYSGTACGAGDIVSVAVDLDNNKLYFAKNGASWMNSGDPTSGATGTGAISITAASATQLGNYFFGASAWHGSAVNHYFNFGGCSGFDVTSANQDADGYGNFEYAVPSGYFAPCTKNLAEYG